MGYHMIAFHNPSEIIGLEETQLYQLWASLINYGILEKELNITQQKVIVKRAVCFPP